MVEQERADETDSATMTKNKKPAAKKLVIEVQPHWEHEYRLVGQGAVFAVLNQNNQEGSPAFGKWSVRTGNTLVSNGYSVYFLTEAEAIKMAESRLGVKR